jgi:hypothetical protein
MRKKVTLGVTVGPELKFHVHHPDAKRIRRAAMIHRLSVASYVRSAVLRQVEADEHRER